MDDSYAGDPFTHDAFEFVPGQFGGFLTALSQSMQPGFADFGAECIEGAQVAGHAVVVQRAGDDAGDTFALYRHGKVAVAHQPLA